MNRTKIRSIESRLFGLILATADDQDLKDLNRELRNIYTDVCTLTMTPGAAAMLQDPEEGAKRLDGDDQAKVQKEFERDYVQGVIDDISKHF